MQKLPYFAAGLTATIFGFSFMFTKGALDFVTPYQLLAFRFLVAALLLSLLKLCGVIKVNLKKGFSKDLFLLALFQPVLYFLCETNGVKLTTTSEAGLMISLIPILVTILAACFLQEVPNPFQVGSVLLSVCGASLIIFAGWKIELSGEKLGQLLLLGAVLSAAVYNILSRKLSPQLRPVEITYVMMWTGALFFGLVALYDVVSSGGAGITISTLFHKEVVTAVLYLGIFSSTLAFFGLNYSLSKLESARSAVFANLSTIISVLVGAVVRGEPVYWYHLVGGVLILLGVWGTNFFAG